METTDWRDPVKKALAEAQELLPLKREALKGHEESAATLRKEIRELETGERQCMVALGQKRPARKTKATPEKPKRGRPPKAKATPPAEVLEEGPETKEGVPIRCARPCGWTGKVGDEEANGACPKCGFITKAIPEEA